MADTMERTVSITAGEDGLRLVIGDAELRLTPELAAEVCSTWLAYRQSVDHDAEPVCDHCREAVEADSLATPTWIHKAGTDGWPIRHYTCGRPDGVLATGATVNSRLDVR